MRGCEEGPAQIAADKDPLSYVIALRNGAPAHDTRPARTKLLQINIVRSECQCVVVSFLVVVLNAIMVVFVGSCFS